MRVDHAEGRIGELLLALAPAESCCLILPSDGLLEVPEVTARGLTLVHLRDRLLHRLGALVHRRDQCWVAFPPCLEEVIEQVMVLVDKKDRKAPRAV